MTYITNNQFNEYLDEFNQLLVNELISTNNENNLSIVNNYIKKIDKPFNKSYLFISLKINSPIESIKIDFTILYDDFYTVPILYFNVYDINHQDEISLKRIEKFNKNQLKVSLESHPFTNNTCYCIHPCETLNGMQDFINSANILETEDSKLFVIKYLIIWFGIYGIPAIYPYINLRININQLQLGKP